MPFNEGYNAATVSYGTCVAAGALSTPPRWTRSGLQNAASHCGMVPPPRVHRADMPGQEEGSSRPAAAACGRRLRLLISESDCSECGPLRGPFLMVAITLALRHPGISGAPLTLDTRKTAFKAWNGNSVRRRCCSNACGGRGPVVEDMPLVGHATSPWYSQCGAGSTENQVW